MKLGIVINVYVAADKNVYHTFDHPTYLDEFEKVETLSHTIQSINALEAIEEDVKLYLFGIDVSKSTANDAIIEAKINKIVETSKYPYEIITNSHIAGNQKKYDSDFYSVENYSTIRNQGFLYAAEDDMDYVIQIDDDEILRESYLVTLRALLCQHSDKSIFTAPYEKNGTVMITTKDDLKSWEKFSSMNKDMTKLMSDHTIKESIFGFGGNMIIHKDVFETMFHPEDVTRGEDFSFLLATRLLYENGNALTATNKHDARYRSFFVPDQALTIIHKPPYEAKKEYLFYLEKNLTRFIYDWGRFKSQSHLDSQGLESLSFYMSKMIDHHNMKDKVGEILEELSARHDNKKLNELRDKLYLIIDQVSQENLYDKFARRQKEYTDLVKIIKAASNNPSKENRASDTTQ